MAQLSALNGIFPEQGADQQQIQQRLAMAQALMQSGMAPGNPTQTATGGFAIPESPLNGLAKIAQVLAGKKLQSDANQASIAMNQAYAKRLGDMFGVNNTSDQSLQGQGPLQPQNQVPNQAPQQSSMVIPGMTPQQAMFAAQVDMPGYMKKLADALTTNADIRKNDQLGIPRTMQSQAALNDLAGKGLINVRPGGTVFSPVGGPIFAAPNGSIGTYFDNGQPRQYSIPGGNAAQAASAQANATGAGLGKAATTVVAQTTPTGETTLTTPLKQLQDVNQDPGNTTKNPATQTAPAVRVQSPSEAEADKEAAKNSANIEPQLRKESQESQDTQLVLNQLEDHLNKLNSTGRIEAAKKSLADWKVAFGVGDDDDKKLAANAGAADKLTTQLASKLTGELTSRATQFDFKTFLQNVPGKDLTDPYLVIRDLRQTLDQPVQKYSTFSKWAQDKNPRDYSQFNQYWNDYRAQQLKAQKDAIEAASPSASQVQSGQTGPKFLGFQ